MVPHFRNSVQRQRSYWDAQVVEGEIKVVPVPDMKQEQKVKEYVPRINLRGGNNGERETEHNNFVRLA